MGGYPKPLADCPNCSAGDWVCPRCKSQAEDARKGLAELRAAVIEEQRLCALKCKSLAEQLAERDRAIAEFCARSAWAVESWRQQPHIKALFDLAGLAGKKEE